MVTLHFLIIYKPLKCCKLLSMKNYLKKYNILPIIKLVLISLIFCLPKVPLESRSTTQVFSNLSSLKTYTFLLPSNGHFEHKVLKKISLIESFKLTTKLSLRIFSYLLDHSLPSYTFIKISYFISSSLARGPPALS